MNIVKIYKIYYIIQYSALVNEFFVATKFVVLPVDREKRIESQGHYTGFTVHGFFGWFRTNFFRTQHC